MGDLADEYDWADYISPEEIDDVNPDEPGTASGSFQAVIDKFATYQSPPRPITTERIADMFGVSAEYVGKASDHATGSAMGIQVVTSKHMPKDTSYVLSMDPAVPERGMILMVDEASQILDSRRPHSDHVHTRLSGLIAQYPSYAAWAEKYTNVPQKINNPKEKYTMDMSGIAKMRSDLEGMLAKFTSMVAIVERFGGEPVEGTVIKFEHEFDEPGRTGETLYTYVAIRKGGWWYVSGRPLGGSGGVKWAKLLEFIGEGRAWVCREFEEVPVPGAAADTEADKAAAVADLLANSGGRDTAEVAAEVVALLESK